MRFLCKREKQVEVVVDRVCTHLKKGSVIVRMSLTSRVVHEMTSPGGNMNPSTGTNM